MIFAALSAPQPTMASSEGAILLDPDRDLAVSLSISSASSRKCSTSRSASRRTTAPSE